MCKVTESQIAADGQVAGNALDQIANAAKAEDPILATNLEAAASTLETATANCHTGTPLTDVETAETAVLAILNVIPETAPYSTFVAIAFTALEALIANMATQSTQTGDELPDAVTLRKAMLALPESHWHGMVHIHRWPGEGPRTALSRRWNDQVEKQPDLGFKKL